MTVSNIRLNDCMGVGLVTRSMLADGDRVGAGPKELRNLAYALIRALVSFAATE